VATKQQGQNKGQQAKQNGGAKTVQILVQKDGATVLTTTLAEDVYLLKVRPLLN